MRDTGDMMEDALSEDTLMECGSDDASLDDLVDLTTDISHSTPTIRDAAERLLTLLGVDDNEDDDLLSSSEDEGVELDEDSEEDDDEDDDDPANRRLLHQLAASLAQELKYSQKQVNTVSTRLGSLQRGSRSCHEVNRSHTDSQVQCMEVAHEISHREETKNKNFPSCYVDQSSEYKTASGRNYFGASNFDSIPSTSPSKLSRTETRYRAGNHVHNDGKTTVLGTDSVVSGSWAAGWDACAAEAIRYLVEDEGLSSHHPTVLAMKSHLEIQRERALIQYAM